MNINLNKNEKINKKIVSDQIITRNKFDSSLKHISIAKTNIDKQIIAKLIKTVFESNVFFLKRENLWFMQNTINSKIEKNNNIIAETDNIINTGKVIGLLELLENKILNILNHIL